MKRTVLSLVLLLVGGGYAQPPGVSRPKIIGIDHVAFYTTNPDGNYHLYSTVLGLGTAEPIESGERQRFVVGRQWVGYSPAPDSTLTDRMDHVAFATDDCESLRNYLESKGVKVAESVEQPKNGNRSFALKDPEGHRIEFVELPKEGSHLLVALPAQQGGNPGPVSGHLIHAGFIVRNRDAEDHFYRDILGFHVYWYGGMKPDRTDWVAMQVPDGTDWLEYMLNVDAKPSLQLSGVMNHISLGVPDMKQAQAKLESHGWKAHGEERAQMGKDGKWQLNLYNPDFTRIELMEFKPSQKPCCSEFQGAHPHEP
jgi:catechol 2,3-dioxygenase-like lactoylglutathione lyase family enzyme